MSGNPLERKGASRVPLGKIGMTDAGPYAPDKSFNRMDVVHTADSSYYSIQPDNLGHPLSDTAWWRPLASGAAATSAAEAAMAAAGSANIATSAAIDAADAANKAASSASGAETLRVQAESARVEAESTRVSQESARVSQESTRQSQESARSSAEEGRVSAESSRVKAESARVAAESSRAGAESTRQSQESTRASQESARQSAESARSTAEQGRVSAESSRQSQESTRQSQESTRTEAEKTRVSQESARQSSVATMKQTTDAATSAANAAAADARAAISGWEEKFAPVIANEKVQDDQIAALESGKTEEAPKNGRTYARRDGKWVFVNEPSINDMSFHVDINEPSTDGSNRVDHGGNDKMRQASEEAVKGILLASDGRFVYLDQKDNRYTEYGDYILAEDGSLKPEYAHLDMMNIIPKQYSKIVQTAVADKQVDRLHLSLDPIPLAAEIPQLVVGKFKANAAGGILRSIPNVVPSSSINIRTFWDYAQKRGASFGLANDDFDMFLLTYMMSKYGYRDSQGCKTSDGTPVWGVGLDGTESTAGDKFAAQRYIKTGSTLSLGTHDGKVEVPDASGDLVHPVSVLGFENAWGQYWEYRQGMCSVGQDVYLWRENWVPPISPAPTADTFAGHDCATVRRNAGDINGNFRLALVTEGNYQGFHVVPASTASGINFGDYYWYNAGGQLWLRGGRSSHGSSCGLACSHSNSVWSTAYSNVAARLAYYGALKHCTKEEILQK